MTAIPDNIARRIRKCMALSASSNEHEAAAALRQAQKLMAEYGLTADGLMALEVGVGEAESQRCTQPAAWEHQLTGLLMSTFGCLAVFTPGVFYEQNRSASTRGQFKYIGLSTHVEMAVYAHAVLSRQIEKARAAFVAKRAKSHRDNGLGEMSRGEKIAVGATYCTGFIISLREKVTALSLEPEQTRAIEARKQSMLSPDSKPMKAAKRGFNRDAYLAGLDDGKSASIHRPVGSAAETLKLESTT